MFLQNLGVNCIHRIILCCFIWYLMLLCKCFSIINLGCIYADIYLIPWHNQNKNINYICIADKQLFGFLCDIFCCVLLRHTLHFIATLFWSLFQGLFSSPNSVLLSRVFLPLLLFTQLG